MKRFWNTGLSAARNLGYSSYVEGVNIVKGVESLSMCTFIIVGQTWANLAHRFWSSILTCSLSLIVSDCSAVANLFQAIFVQNEGSYLCVLHSWLFLHRRFLSSIVLSHPILFLSRK